jgi:hypothetical protein
LRCRRANRRALRVGSLGGKLDLDGSELSGMGGARCLELLLQIVELRT